MKLWNCSIKANLECKFWSGFLKRQGRIPSARCQPSKVVLLSTCIAFLENCWDAVRSNSKQLFFKGTQMQLHWNVGYPPYRRLTQRWLRSSLQSTSSPPAWSSSGWSLWWWWSQAPPGYPESPQKTGLPPLGFPQSPPEYPQVLWWSWWRWDWWWWWWWWWFADSNTTWVPSWCE